jgi:hypothetical protein
VLPEELLGDYVGIRFVERRPHPDRDLFREFGEQQLQEGLAAWAIQHAEVCEGLVETEGGG